jgi:hypothetical protein
VKAISRSSIPSASCAVSESVQVIGDDYLVTSARRITEASRAEACNAVLSRGAIHDRSEWCVLSENHVSELV